MKPLYCGNLEYEARQSEIERLFGRYGRVERVDMKSGKNNLPKQYQPSIIAMTIQFRTEIYIHSVAHTKPLAPSLC